MCIHFTPPEIWRPVPGWEGIYSVSDLGRVRRDKPVPRNPTGILLGSPARDGYLQVNLHAHGHDSTLLTHRLVLLAFVGPCPGGHEVNHKNGIKIDNRLVNLEYVTHTRNMQHAAVAGWGPSGAGHPWAKITPEIVRLIRKLRSDGLTYRAISAVVGVNESTIGYVVRGDSWKHVEP